MNGTPHDQSPYDPFEQIPVDGQDPAPAPATDLGLLRVWLSGFASGHASSTASAHAFVLGHEPPEHVLYRCREAARSATHGVATERARCEEIVAECRMMLAAAALDERDRS